MKAPDWNERLFEVHRGFIRADDVLRAFDFLTAAAFATNLYIVQSVGAARQKKSFDYDDSQTKQRPFAFIVNREHLLFYIRRPGVARFSGGIGFFKNAFSTVRENPNGEWTIRIETLEEAVRLQSMVFGTAKSSGIPVGISKEDVIQAIVDIEAGNAEDRFGDSRLWDVLFEGRLYPPKRVVGLAARRLAGRALLPSEFTGGEESKCHAILEELGFKIVPKGDTQETHSVEDRQIEAEIRGRVDISETKREQLIDARRGQGRFRREVAAVEKKGCRVTGVSHIAHLRASHIKPWSNSDDRERLDPYNGLLLSPHIDHLFDRGFISFTDEGDLIVSRRLKPAVLSAWGLATSVKVGAFKGEQRVYLEYHRRNVFQK
jgi:HNH endonuclease